jgi:hypothetical protein
MSSVGMVGDGGLLVYNSNLPQKVRLGLAALFFNKL